MKLLIRHLFRFDQLAVHVVKLKPAHHISDLVKGPVIATKRTSDLGGGVVPFVADSFDEKIDTFLRRHFFKMEAERKDYPGTAVHPPKECPYLVPPAICQSPCPTAETPSTTPIPR